MANTKIEWVEKVWNPVTGCTPISAGCRNCYAERMARRFPGTWGLVDDPFAVTFHPKKLGDPLKWKKPKRVFIVSMGDLFHEEVLYEWRDEVVNVIGTCEQCERGHEFIILTKRPQQALEYILDSNENAIEKNVPTFRQEGVFNHTMFGVTVEHQSYLYDRIKTGRGVAELGGFAGFLVSCEPMLGPLDFRKVIGAVDWLIVGCESGAGARECKLEWVRDLRDQCKESGVAFFAKQLRADGKLVKDIGEFPEDLRIRERPVWL